MVGGQGHALVALPPGKRSGTLCAGDFVVPGAGVVGCGISLPYRHSIPARSSS